MMFPAVSCPRPPRIGEPVRISVIGCGYLGSVHAVALVSDGHDVVAIDIDPDRVAGLSAGVAPFFEPGLDDALAAALATGRLRFAGDIAAATGSKVHFITVGTPQSSDGLAADVSAIDAVVGALAAHVAPGDLVVGKSTVPVGTAARLSTALAALAPGSHLAWNPEFLREGHAIADSVAPDRLVFGVAGGDPQSVAVQLLDEVYSAQRAAGVVRIVTDFATAELAKVAANAYLATRISFINTMADVADATGADVTVLADAIGLDPRIGRQYLNAGIGYGGGCLPKDIRGFLARGDELGLAPSFAALREVDAANLRRRAAMARRVAALLGGSASGRRVAVLGAAFKADSDDVRDSPALDVVQQLSNAGAIVSVADPRAAQNATDRLRGGGLAITVGTDWRETVRDAEIVLVLTEWQQYRDLDPAAVAGLAAGRIVVDGRNCLDPVRWREAGWTYQGVGRP